MFTVLSWLPRTVSLTGDRAHGDDSKHCAYCTLLYKISYILYKIS